MDAAPLVQDEMTKDDTPVVSVPEPFEAFFRREYRQVVGLAAVLGGSVSIAEDLAQEAFVATLKQWDRIGAMDNPGAWVRRIVANRSVSLFRRGITEIKALTHLGERAGGNDGVAIEIGLDIWTEVRRLPRRQAQAVVLTYLLDTPRKEVAEILECSEETVKTHLERARSRLAERLDDNGDDR